MISFDVPLPAPRPDATHIRVSVTYQKAGVNYWTYQQEPQGFMVICQPIVLKDSCVSWVMGSGRKAMLQPANRNNQKTLRALRDQCKAEIESKNGLAWELFSKVTAKGETPCA